MITPKNLLEIRRIKKQNYPDPCLFCKYKTQACAYFLDGKKPKDACMKKAIWLKGNTTYIDGD